MRIDILPDNAAAMPDPGVPKPEGDRVQGGSNFLAVIGKMTSAMGSQRQAEEEGLPRRVTKKDDSERDKACAPFQPVAYRNPEDPHYSARGDPPRVRGKFATQERDVAEGAGGAGKNAGPPLSAGESADGSILSPVMNAPIGPSPDSIVPTAVPEGLTNDLSPAAADPVAPLDPSVPGLAPSFVSGPPVESASAQTELDFVAPPNPGAQTSALPGHANISPRFEGREPVASALEDALPSTVSELLLSSDATVSDDVSTPLVEEQAGPIGILQDSVALEPILPNEDVPVLATAADPVPAAKAAPLTTAREGLKNGAASGNARDGSMIRSQAKVTQPAARPDPAANQQEALRPTPGTQAESHRAAQQSELVPVLPEDESASEDAIGPRNQARAADIRAAQENTADGSAAPIDAAECAWVDMQNAQRMLYHGLSTRSSTETPVLVAPRPLQQAASMSSTTWAAAAQTQPQAAGAELKALLAHLAPKSSEPTQTPDFFSQLSGRIQAQLRDHANIIRIQLKPGNLGRMEIQAETSASGVLATIITESSRVKDYLENNLHLLQQNFQDQGLKVDRIHVTIQQDHLSQQSSSGSQESSSGTSRHGDARFSGHNGGRLARADDELVLDEEALAFLSPHSTFHAIA